MHKRDKQQAASENTQQGEGGREPEQTTGHQDAHVELPPSKHEGTPNSETVAPITALICENRIALACANPVGTLGYR